jgi:protein-tyrosine-phosphatase
MLGRKKKETAAGRKSVLFIDEMNDLQSQIAEYFLIKFYGDMYEVRSAGPKKDHVDCELVSVMYQNGHDIRRTAVSKDFNARNMIDYDYIIFLQRSTYDSIHDLLTFPGKHILKDFGSRKDFKATDDLELANCYIKLAEDVGAWVKETFSSPENLDKLAV